MLGIKRLLQIIYVVSWVFEKLRRRHQFEMRHRNNANSISLINPDTLDTRVIKLIDSVLLNNVMDNCIFYFILQLLGLYMANTSSARKSARQSDSRSVIIKCNEQVIAQPSKLLKRLSKLGTRMQHLRHSLLLKGLLISLLINELFMLTKPPGTKAG